MVHQGLKFAGASAASTMEKCNAHMFSQFYPAAPFLNLGSAVLGLTFLVYCLVLRALKSAVTYIVLLPL